MPFEASFLYSMRLYSYSGHVILNYMKSLNLNYVSRQLNTDLGMINSFMSNTASSPV